MLLPLSLIRDFGKQNTVPAETFPKLPSVFHIIHQLQPLVWPSNPPYVMLSGCDWWISIRSFNNRQDWRILETFPQVFCFAKSRVNENGGNRRLYCEINETNVTYRLLIPENCHWNYKVVFFQDSLIYIRKSINNRLWFNIVEHSEVF